MNFTANHKKKWYRKNQVLIDIPEEENMSTLEYFHAEPYRPKSNKETVTKRYRYLTIEEYKALKPGGRVDVVGTGGKIYNCKVNGKPQVWKTRPGDVRVPLKYGLYESHQAFYTNGELFGTRIVAEVPELTNLVSSGEEEAIDSISEIWVEMGDRIAKEMKEKS